MLKEEKYKEILFAIDSARNILITMHENPDGDAIGSACAFYEFLYFKNKNCAIFCADETPGSLKFLPHTEKISNKKEEIDFNKHDLAIVFDCGGLFRSKIDDEIMAVGCQVINIDHHLSNDNFGNINLVDTSAVATAQIIYDFFKYSKAPISKGMANCILTGIQTDSGNFAYTNTNKESFKIAGEMLARGANIRDIVSSTEKNKTVSSLKLWGKALNRLQRKDKYGIAFTVLTQKDLVEYEATKNELEGLAGFLNSLKDVKMTLVLYETGDGRVKGSLRTNRDEIDVSRLAKILGGGGHEKASGFEIKGQLKKTGGGWQIA